MIRMTIVVAGLAIALINPAFSQGSPYSFVRGYPTPETTQRVREDANFQGAVTAYRFWYPMVSTEGIFDGNRSVGIEDGKAWGIAAAGPRQVGFTLNSDTPYGSGVVDVSNGPMVIELPPGAFIGLVNDHHQGWVMDMGLPGPDKGRGGKHLILPPGYTGRVPDGYQVGRSRSLKNLFAIRALPIGGDIAKTMDALRAVKVYTLATAGNPQPLQIIDTTERAMDSSSLRWEDNIQFWEILSRIIQDEPLVASFLPMYGLLSALGVENGEPFNPDARTRV